MAAATDARQLLLDRNRRLFGQLQVQRQEIAELEKQCVDPPGERSAAPGAESRREEETSDPFFIFPHGRTVATPREKRGDWGGGGGVGSWETRPQDGTVQLELRALFVHSESFVSAPHAPPLLLALPPSVSPLPAHPFGSLPRFSSRVSALESHETSYARGVASLRALAGELGDAAALVQAAALARRKRRIGGDGKKEPTSGRDGKGDGDASASASASASAPASAPTATATPASARPRSPLPSAAQPGAGRPGSASGSRPKSPGSLLPPSRSASSSKHASLLDSLVASGNPFLRRLSLDLSAAELRALHLEAAAEPATAGEAGGPGAGGGGSRAEEASGRDARGGAPGGPLAFPPSPEAMECELRDRVRGALEAAGEALSALQGGGDEDSEERGAETSVSPLVPAETLQASLALLKAENARLRAEVEALEADLKRLGTALADRKAELAIARRKLAEKEDPSARDASTGEQGRKRSAAAVAGPAAGPPAPAPTAGGVAKVAAASGAAASATPPAVSGLEAPAAFLAAAPAAALPRALEAELSELKTQIATLQGELEAAEAAVVKAERCGKGTRVREQARAAIP